MASKYEDAQSISPHLDALLKQATDKGYVRVHDAIEELGESSITMALVMFTFLSTLPLFSIPGFTTVTGVPIILLGGQLLFRAHAIWMPQRIRDKELSSEKLWRFVRKSLPAIRWIEARLHPRLLFMSTPPMRMLLGAAFVLMGILLALPIPFVNFPAGFSMFVLAIGLAERDGIIIIVGLTLIVAIFASIGYGSAALGAEFTDWMPQSWSSGAK